MSENMKKIYQENANKIEQEQDMKERLRRRMYTGMQVERRGKRE